MTAKSSLIVAAAILLGSLLLGHCQRYELVAPGGNSHIMLLDRATGRIWMKYQNPSSGPTNWERVGP